MEDKDLDKWLAEEVMGWKQMRVVSPIHGPWMADRLMEDRYVDKNTNPSLTASNRDEMRIIVKKHYKCRVSNWQPTKNISQAMECLEKLRDDGYLIIIHNPVINWRVEILKGDDNLNNEVWQIQDSTEAVNGLPQAICQAIYKTYKKNTCNPKTNDV